MMFILDSSSLIKIFKESRYRGLMDKVIEFDKNIFVPSLVEKYELRKNGTLTETGMRLAEYISSGKIRVLHNTDWEIREFDSDMTPVQRRKFGHGEKGVMIAYKYINTGLDACCVIDEIDGTKYAKSHGFKVINTDQLLEKMNERNIIGAAEHADIMRNLNKELSSY